MEELRIDVIEVEPNINDYVVKVFMVDDEGVNDKIRIEKFMFDDVNETLAFLETNLD